MANIPNDVFARIIINRQNAGGDVLMVEPIVRSIHKQRNGNCQIDVCTAPHNVDCIDHSPYVNKVVNGFNFFNYDIVINLDGAYEKYPKLHPINAYSKIALGFELSKEDFRPIITTNDEDKIIAEQIKQYTKKYIVMHMRDSENNLDSRNIDKNIWNQLIQIILNNTDFGIIVVGAPSDHFPTISSRIIDLREKLKIKQLKEIIESSEAFIGSDSLPAHVANSTDVPSLVLYTSAGADIRMYKSKDNSIPIKSNIECYGCRKFLPPPVYSSSCKRGDVECTRRFDPIDIFTKLLTILDINKI